MLTKDQVRNRTQYLGCSEFAAALGLDPWKSPLKLWAEKSGQLPIEDASDKLQVKLGHRLEPVVTELFREWMVANGLPDGKVVNRTADIVHKTHPFLVGHVDRMVLPWNHVLEIKTASPWRLKEFQNDEWPATWLVQVHGYMAITGAERAYIAALFGNQEFLVKIVARDRELEADIIRKVVDFWNNFVLTKTMPAAIRHDDAPTLYGLFPEPTMTMIDLPDQANILAENIEAYGKDMQQLMDQREEARNRLRAMLKENTVGRTDKFTVTWKEVKKKLLDTEAIRKQEPEIYKRFGKMSAYRELRIRRDDGPNTGA
jgi:putative phage-type endonuclease